MTQVSLKDFVAETLASISDGVRAAQVHSRENDGIPIAPSTVDGQKLSVGDQLVRFQVTVEVSSGSEGAAKGQLGAAFLSVVTGSMEAEARKQKQDATQHTIEFSIPMHFQLSWAAHSVQSEGA